SPQTAAVPLPPAAPPRPAEDSAIYSASAVRQPRRGRRSCVDSNRFTPVDISPSTCLPSPAPRGGGDDSRPFPPPPRAANAGLSRNRKRLLHHRLDELRSRPRDGRF